MCFAGFRCVPKYRLFFIVLRDDRHIIIGGSFNNLETITCVYSNSRTDTSVIANYTNSSMITLHLEALGERDMILIQKGFYKIKNAKYYRNYR